MTSCTVCEGHCCNECAIEVESGLICPTCTEELVAQLTGEVIVSQVEGYEPSAESVMDELQMYHGAKLNLQEMRAFLSVAAGHAGKAAN